MEVLSEIIRLLLGMLERQTGHSLRESEAVYLSHGSPNDSHAD
jgi:hypothetical protein